MDKLMAFLHKVLQPITKLGGGVEGVFPAWVPWLGGKVWQLWPFVAVAIFLVVIIVLDKMFS